MGIIYLDVWINVVGTNVCADKRWAGDRQCKVECFYAAISGNYNVGVFNPSIEYTIHKASCGGVRWEDARYLMLEKESGRAPGWLRKTARRGIYKRPRKVNNSRDPS